MSSNLVIADVLTAIMWPIVVLIILYGYRKEIPSIADGLTSRISKVEFAGFGIALAVAKPYLPDTEKSEGSLEFWHKAVHTQVMDSYANTFFNQLTEGGTADYAEINLAHGMSWLSSRLYIISILYPQIKGVKCFVFVCEEENLRKKYVGWANAQTLRWSLARRYPWLEKAFLEAYNQLLNNGAQIVSEQGRLDYPHDPKKPKASIDLLREFLQRIQLQILQPGAVTSEWVSLFSNPPNYEHAEWINSELLEGILQDNLNTNYIWSSEIRSKSIKDQYQTILSMSGSFVAVTTNDYRFEYLIDRLLLLEQYAIKSKT